MPQLTSIRSNLHYTVNYETLLLVPQIEVIMLVSQPVYSENKKGEIMKNRQLKEIRFETSLEGVNALIGELQALATNMTTFEQMGGALNHVIKGMKESKNSNP